MRTYFKRAAAVLVISYLGMAVVSVSTCARIEQDRSQRLLTDGLVQLANDPDGSGRSFANAGVNATLGLKKYQLLPWWSRILAPLPPFRYRVVLLQGEIQLASAGQQASVLRSSFPQLLDRQSTSTSAALATAMDRETTWYQAHQPEVSRLARTLQEAAGHFPPSQNQVRSLFNDVNEGMQVSDALVGSISQVQLHNAVEVYDGNNNLIGTAVGVSGRVQAVQFQSGLSHQPGAVRVLVPDTLMINLLTAFGPLDAAGVAGSTVSAEGLRGGKATPPLSLSALSAYLLTHPEQLSHAQQIASKNPPRLLEP